MTTATKTRLENKLNSIEKAIASYDGDTSRYAARQILSLNMQAHKIEKQLNSNNGR